jgi:hypothetical protein
MAMQGVAHAQSIGGGGQVVQKEKTANGDIAVLGNTSRPHRQQHR